VHNQTAIVFWRKARQLILPFDGYSGRLQIDRVTLSEKGGKKSLRTTKLPRRQMFLANAPVDA
jgi:hypothetical protein